MIKQSSNPLQASVIADSAILRRELAALNEEYTKLLNWQDLVIRALRNSKFSPIYTALYLSLIDTYPQLLAGEPVDIQIWRVRENAGWVPERSATRFFQDMNTINAFLYDAGKYSKKSEDRVGRVTPNPDLFSFPESFDTSTSERKRKAKDAEAKRRAQFKDPHSLRLQCEECGTELTYDLTAKCGSCGHVHAVNNVPASNITIEAEVFELAEDQFIDSFLNESTERRQAVRPIAIQQQLPASASVKLGKQASGKPCIDCGSLNHFRPVKADWGGMLYICNLCDPA